VGEDLLVVRTSVLKLQSFLQSGRAVMDELTLTEDAPARTQQIMAGAAKQFDQLSSGAPAVVKDLVRKVVQRVVVHADRIEVEVGKQKLRATLPQRAPRPTNWSKVRVMSSASISRRGSNVVAGR